MNRRSFLSNAAMGAAAIAVAPTSLLAGITKPPMPGPLKNFDPLAHSIALMRDFIDLGYKPEELAYICPNKKFAFAVLRGAGIQGRTPCRTMHSVALGARATVPFERGMRLLTESKLIEWFPEEVARREIYKFRRDRLQSRSMKETCGVFKAYWGSPTVEDYEYRKQCEGYGDCQDILEDAFACDPYSGVKLAIHQEFNTPPPLFEAVFNHLFSKSTRVECHYRQDERGNFIA